MGGPIGARAERGSLVTRNNAQTMSQENVDAGRRVIDGYNRRDREAIGQDLDSDIEWHSGVLAAVGGEAAVFRGHRGVRDALRDLYEALGETQIECSEFRDLGDRVVTIGRFHARGKESGAEAESPWGGVADFKND